jgi:hypothetical protein
MFGTFALLSLVLMLVIRYKFGPTLWDDMALKSSYAILGFIATGVAIVNGSLGGEAGFLGMALSGTWNLLGITPSNPMVLPTLGGIAFLVVVLVAIAAMVIG